MSPPTSMDRDTFLRCLRDSGLVSPDRLMRALVQVPQSDRGRIVARSLVEQSVLTRFQAERLLAGRTEGFIIGQYRILDMIGRGGMGRVYKAEHITMNRVVALKVLTSQLMKTERARQLFNREVRAAAQLSHPNIVTAFDANQSGDRAYLVMEYVDGPNLHDFVKEKGPMPITQACDVIRQVALGLQYAHELGMVHRDIKPANLLLQPTPSRAHSTPFLVKILDFGLARLAVPDDPNGQPNTADSIVSNAQSVIGTPDYLSPEQARDIHNADLRSDLYALGCTMYYLLTGQVPFPGGSVLEKLVRHGSEEPRPIESLRPPVPPGLAAIVRKLMAKNPAYRFQSCNELIDAMLPYCTAGADSWVPIEAMPVLPQTLPATGVFTVQADESPWAILNDDHSMHGTLSGEVGVTSVQTVGPSLSGSGWLRTIVMLGMMLGVTAGVLLAILMLIGRSPF